MKKILYLSFYFEPDLCAGSFRNSPLAKELASKLTANEELVVITTQPNRYKTFKLKAPSFERINNITIYRIKIPEHKSGFKDQIVSFWSYYRQARKIAAKEKFDLVFASSSRLFTAYLGYRIAFNKQVPLYLDIRDIFTHNMEEILKNKSQKTVIMPILNYFERVTFSHATHINLISAGFAPYFSKYTNPAYSYYSNGIDEEFIDVPKGGQNNSDIKQVVYAGNIGEGQGLHTIIPKAAKALEGRFKFLIVGDGGAKEQLLQELNRVGASNVVLMDPVKRTQLKELYQQSDFFFIHLNDYEAFKIVLPSKIFELGAYDKPIIAGVGGYAQQFMRENVSNSILFEPGDAENMIRQLNNYQYRLEERVDFVSRFRRSRLNALMADSIIKYLP
jgi:glycosyltransferase involved in cell wall biosynthesis